MVDEQCTTGLNLFPETNDTEQFFGRLSKFREAYEPYHAYICCIICTFGVLTNIINILVLTNRQMRTSVNVLLTGIAICDMATMFSYLIYVIQFLLVKKKCDSTTYGFGWMAWLVNHAVLSIAFHSTDLWLAVAVAFVRRMTLKDVRLGSKWMRRQNAWKICAFITVTVFTLCLPNVFSQNVIEVTKFFNHSCSSQVANGEKFYTIYIPNCTVYQFNLWVNGIVFKTIPCILLVLLSSNLLHMLREAKKHKIRLLNAEQKNVNNNNNNNTNNIKKINLNKVRTDRTTLMLIVILFVFLITELPQGILTVLTGVFLRDVQRYIYPNLGDILDLLSLINSSVNFLLYCAMSSKYRHVFWKVLLPRKVYVRWYIRGAVSNVSKSLNGYVTHSPVSVQRVLKISRAQNNDSTWEFKETYVEDHNI